MLHHGPSPMDDPANNSKSSWRYLPSSEVSARTEERTAEPQDPMNHSEVDPVEHDGGDRVRESPNRNGKGIRPKPTLSRGGTDCMYKESLVDHRTDDPDSPFEAAMIQIGPSKSHIFKNGPSTEDNILNWAPLSTLHPLNPYTLLTAQNTKQQRKRGSGKSMSGPRGANRSKPKKLKNTIFWRILIPLPTISPHRELAHRHLK
ncbi:hypothetical protein JHK82_044516 [Glycine max]|nr:hypothetical protein JHK82_044516 [Glycine max]